MTSTNVDTTGFVDRYLQVWNESDPATRAQLVRELWAADAVEYTEANEYRGHEALEVRVTKAHTQFVEEGGFLFQLMAPPTTHHGAVLINVEMVPAEGGGEPPWIGTIIALLDDQDRVGREYQFGRNLRPA
jgi:uncharacterized protein